MTGSIPPPDPLSYTGQVVVPFIQRISPPTNTFINFPVPTIWIDTLNSNAYILVSKLLGVADWLFLGGTPGPLQTLTGDTGGAIAPIASNINIIGGDGCEVDGSSGTLEINVVGSGLHWIEATGDMGILGNHGYVVNNGALVTLTLPTVCPLGATIQIVGKGSGGWSIALNSGQRIYFGNKMTSLGALGSLASSHFGDCITLSCITANQDFRVSDSVGDITYV